MSNSFATSGKKNAFKYAAVLREADMIFVDAAKDGYLEQRLLDHFAEIGLKDRALIVLDDIRFWQMLTIWRGITHPKLDLTSVGHWSGTGIVEWRSGK